MKKPHLSGTAQNVQMMELYFLDLPLLRFLAPMVPGFAFEARSSASSPESLRISSRSFAACSNSS